MLKTFSCLLLVAVGSLFLLSACKSAEDSKSEHPTQEHPTQEHPTTNAPAAKP
jgi:hypothetical protein